MTPKLVLEVSYLEHLERYGLRPAGYLDKCFKNSDPDGTTRRFTPQGWMSVNEWVRSNPLTVPEYVRARRAICATCVFNVNNICEHPACLPCKQRHSGGLTYKTSQPNETCPESKWPK
jgi:hypothetical protein